MLQRLEHRIETLPRRRPAPARRHSEVVVGFRMARYRAAFDERLDLA